VVDMLWRQAHGRLPCKPAGVRQTTVEDPVTDIRTQANILLREARERLIARDTFRQLNRQ
jgi:hypothetical protein